jgi:hypothetical protein
MLRLQWDILNQWNVCLYFVKNGLKHALPTYVIRQLMYNTFLSYMPVDIVSAVAQDPRMDCLPKKTMKLYIVDVHALLYEKRATHFGRREGP